MDNENMVDVDTQTNEGEGEQESDTISIPKSDYDKLNQTLGSLKRENKDLKKAKEEPKETPQQTKPDVQLLAKLERISFRQANIEHTDDMELARNTAKKWNMDVDEVLSDPDFKAKLERQQNDRSNVEATSTKARGGAGKTEAKNTPDYWMSKGTPPSPTDIPDRKVRAKIVRAMMENTQKSPENPFYNGK